MTPLNELEQAEIPVTWTTVVMGLEGPGSAPSQIGIREVRSWLDDVLHRDREPERALDVLVAIDTDCEPNRLISELGHRPDQIMQDELRKWQTVMLRRQLADLPADPFYATLALADFWSQFHDGGEVPAPTREDLESVSTASDRERLVRMQETWLATTSESLRRDSSR
jgi:hypothetical protein